MLGFLPESGERVAILLHALGTEISQAILDEMPANQAGRLQQSIREIEAEGVESELVEDVLVEFERFLRFAAAGSDGNGNLPAGFTGARGDTGTADAPGEETNSDLLTIFRPTGNALDDLNQLSSYQVAKALENEHPRIAAAVLKQLTTEASASTLSLLPEESRPQVFLLMNQEDDLSAPLIARVLETTVARAIEVEQPDSDDLDVDARAAALLRSLDKPARKEMLAALQEQDEGMAERVRGLLYEFEDILRFVDRSVQKLLGELEIDTLSVALSDADEAITERVEANLSRRAKERLREEMELVRADAAATAAARKLVTEAMGRLDQAGELELAQP